MRKPEYMSPSSLSLFYQDRSKYYRQYLADGEKVRDPQNHHMSVGSSFDAYVKSYLYKKLVGKPTAEYEFEAMFETQVEVQHRDAARKAGKELFDCYVKIGALADLLIDLDGTIGEPRFESKISGTIARSTVKAGVPLLGKPDLYFVTAHNARVQLDWKCNGYYSEAGVSPKPGYYRLFPSRAIHDKCIPGFHNKFGINTSRNLEQVDKSWATQLATYAWILGNEVGSNIVGVIDQFCCDPIGGQHRVARHSCLIGSAFQVQTFEKYERAWEAIQSGHIFFELPREESDQRCRTLDTPVSPKDDLFRKLTDPGRTTF